MFILYNKQVLLVDFLQKMLHYICLYYKIYIL
jgi:hypothetical protein